ncbi:LPP20 family lipoprotein [bacterium]|nr:LPP20 family lipoprotein [bacterium]
MKIFNLIFIVLLGCSIPKKNLNVSPEISFEDYPTWFLTPPKNNEVLGVGYSEKYFFESGSQKIALENAKQNYSLFSGIEISGERLTANANFEFGSYDYYEEKPLNDFSNSKVFVVSSFVFQDSYFALVGKKENIEIDETFERLSEKMPLEFIELPDSKDLIYAVGSSQTENFSRDFPVWLEAERNARISLAERICGKLSNLTKVENGFSESFTSTKVESVTLRNIEVVKRWKDCKQKIYYVLVRTKN